MQRMVKQSIKGGLLMPILFGLISVASAQEPKSANTDKSVEAMYRLRYMTQYLSLARITSRYDVVQSSGQKIEFSEADSSCP
jgi:hypothetical protein